MKTDATNLDGSRSSAATGGSAVLTLASLAAIAASIPKPPPWRYLTLTPEAFKRLRDDPGFKSDTVMCVGLEVHVKPGQIADSWAFSDTKTFLKYLSGEITELDLMGLIDTGACQSNVGISDQR